MHKKVLPAGSRDLLADIERRVPRTLRGWVLAGGTALALQFGHRTSDDFDLFKTSETKLEGVLNAARQLGPCETLQQEAGTLTILLRGVKISFFRIRDPFVFQTAPFSFFEVADVRDIALMKLVAIANRGSRKDFADLHEILRRGYSLEDLLHLLPQKYGPGRVNDYQVLKSLVYFDHAEREPMPRMLVPFDWEECKALFLREVHSLT